LGGIYTLGPVHYHPDTHVPTTSRGRPILHASRSTCTDRARVCALCCARLDNKRRASIFVDLEVVDRRVRQGGRTNRRRCCCLCGLCHSRCLVLCGHCHSRCLLLPLCEEVVLILNRDAPKTCGAVAHVLELLQVVQPHRVARFIEMALERCTSAHTHTIHRPCQVEGWMAGRWAAERGATGARTSRAISACCFTRLAHADSARSTPCGSDRGSSLSNTTCPLTILKPAVLRAGSTAIRVRSRAGATRRGGGRVVSRPPACPEQLAHPEQARSAASCWSLYTGGDARATLLGASRSQTVSPRLQTAVACDVATSCSQTVNSHALAPQVRKRGDSLTPICRFIGELHTASTHLVMNS
jgi:hypothetical protein